MLSIHLVPLDPLAEATATQLLRATSSTFGLEAGLKAAPIDMAAAFDASRGQYNSTAILSSLQSSAPGDGSKLLAVTREDLFSPVFTFVFGEAQLNGPLAVVSYHRLRNSFYGLPEDDALLRQRLEKESVHEIGHTFGLVHCPSYMCVMHSSTFVEDIDIKPARFCRRCQSYLSERRNKTD